MPSNILRRQIVINGNRSTSQNASQKTSGQVSPNWGRELSHQVSMQHKEAIQNNYESVYKSGSVTVLPTNNEGSPIQNEINKNRRFNLINSSNSSISKHSGFKKITIQTRPSQIASASDSIIKIDVRPVADEKRTIDSRIMPNIEQRQAYFSDLPRFQELGLGNKQNSSQGRGVKKVFGLVNRIQTDQSPLPSQTTQQTPMRATSKNSDSIYDPGENANMVAAAKDSALSTQGRISEIIDSLKTKIATKTRANQAIK